MKIYNIILLNKSGGITSEQLCGSVTEICKYLDEKFDLDAKEMRKFIVTSFAVNTKLYYQFADGRSLRISQHKADATVQMHGCW